VSQELTIAVITGGHKYNVGPFQDFCNGLDGIKSYIQHFEHWLSAGGEDHDGQEARDSYDVTLFYTLLKGEPEGKECIDHLIETGQPIFVLHHAILNGMHSGPGGLVPPEREWWEKIMGLSDRRITKDDIYVGPYQIAVNKDHPASVGLADFEIYDETYGIGDCHDDCDVLLTTSKEPSMRTLAWSRTYKNSRIFCLQLGHDTESWENPAFKTVVQNGIRWCAGELG
jgi:type 1 glutamine amidotransferase